MEFLQITEIYYPDANSTLRLTWTSTRGFPIDAVSYGHILIWKG